ncbi:MAG: C_GCAxxG_C_C family protein, partial [Bacteroidales bacterium]|nr:C_GCAxxG_C_C family protein [Bacteroidales bacterium]
MLKDKVREYIEYELQHPHQRELYHYNCAEAILHGANDYYSLGLTPKALKMITPFGGGMNTGSTCGILTGGIAVIGALFTEDMPSKNSKLKEVARHWITAFENQFKNTDCTLIKELNQIGNEGCANLILKGADILEEII